MYGSSLLVINIIILIITLIFGIKNKQMGVVISSFLIYGLVTLMFSTLLSMTSGIAFFTVEEYEAYEASRRARNLTMIIIATIIQSIPLLISIKSKKKSKKEEGETKCQE